MLTLCQEQNMQIEELYGLPVWLEGHSDKLDKNGQS